MSAAQQGSGVPIPLIGRLVWAGDLTVDGESITGFAVEMERAALAQAKVPLYQSVALYRTSELVEQQRHIGLLTGMLEGCKFSLSPDLRTKVESLLREVALSDRLIPIENNQAST